MYRGWLYSSTTFAFGLAASWKYYSCIRSFEPYHTKGCLNNEEDETERHQKKNREFALHEFANKSKLKEERLPYQEEEPEDQTEVHDHLDAVERYVN